MLSAASYARARDELVRLVHRGLDVPAFAHEINKVLGRIVPGEGSCLQTVDPATMLPTGDYVEDGLPGDDILRLIEIELAEPDVNKWITLRNAGTTAAGLAEATRGDLDRSTRQREVRRPGGFGDEIRVVLANGAGTWGGLTLFRESDRPHYTPTEVRRLAWLAPVITDGLRRAALLSGPSDQYGHGVLVLNPDDSVAMSDHGADRWLERLSASSRAGASLPLVITAVARHARLLCAGDRLPATGARLASSTAHTTVGWLVVRGSVLGDGPEALVAVTLEGARAPELAGLIAAAYGLTEREREVTALVARGNSTDQIARHLHLSPYTVQDHLKSVFDKTGTSSRGGLVSRLYFDFYAKGDPSVPEPPGLPDPRSASSLGSGCLGGPIGGGEANGVADWSAAAPHLARGSWLVARSSWRPS